MVKLAQGRAWSVRVERLWMRALAVWQLGHAAVGVLRETMSVPVWVIGDQEASSSVSSDDGRNISIT